MAKHKEKEKGDVPDSSQQSSAKKRKRHKEKSKPDPPVETEQEPGAEAERPSPIPDVQESIEEPIAQPPPKATNPKPDKDPYVGANKKNSPFRRCTISMYIPVAPVSQRDAFRGACAEHLSPLIMTYYPPLKGVILSFDNARLSQKNIPNSLTIEEPVLASSYAEYAVSFCYLHAKVVIFSPRPNTTIEGYINIQSESHVGLVCYNLFNASIDRKRLPPDWTWTEGQETRHQYKKSKARKAQDEEDAGDALQLSGIADELGHYVKSDGERLKGALTFRVLDHEVIPTQDLAKSFISIVGTMLELDGSKPAEEEGEGEQNGEE